MLKKRFLRVVWVLVGTVGGVLKVFLLDRLRGEVRGESLHVGLLPGGLFFTVREGGVKA